MDDPDERPIRSRQPAPEALRPGSAEQTKLSELPWLAKFGGMQLHESFDNGALFDTDPSQAERQESLDALLSDLKEFTSTPKCGGGMGGFGGPESTGLPGELTAQPDGSLQHDPSGLLDDGWTIGESPFAGPADGPNPAASDDWGGALLCQSSSMAPAASQDPTLLIPC